MGSRKRLFMMAGCTVLCIVLLSCVLPVPAFGNVLASANLSTTGGFDAPIFGPSSGNLKHDADEYIEVYAADVNVTDFVAEATFYNPYSITKGSWDYGFLFRRPKVNTLHAIRVTSSGRWNHSVDIDKNWSIVGEGKISGLRTGANQYNHLRIIILGDSGAFYVNGEFVTSLDTSGLPQKGDICVATGTYYGNEIDGEVTRFKDFAVWSLDVPISNPSSGNLKHKEDGSIKTYSAGVNVKNFVAGATFYNPYSVTKGNWDYGFLCRHPRANTHHVIRVHSDGFWKHDVVIDGNWNYLKGGKVSGLRTGVNQYNHLRIIVLDNSGEFFVNGKFVTSLDMSGLTSTGDIMAATGMAKGDEIDGEVTRFEDFTVWSLNIRSTFQKKGSIKVTSTPSGAKCYLDGKYKGTTPLLINDVSPGGHTITLKEDDYYDGQRSVNVYAGEMSVIHTTLKPKVGSLDVDCNVDGARVYVDGSYKGKTPVRIDDVLVGRHTVRVSAEKYYDDTKIVTVEVNRTTYVEATLEEKPGSIRVESVPSGAEVYLDGSYKGTTPLTISNVKRGSYTLTIRYSGYYDETRYVDVYPDEITTESIYLRQVFWKTGKFAAGVILCIVVLFGGAFWYKRKQPTPPVPMPAPAKPKSTFESVAEIARAPFVPFERIINIILLDKKDRCPICDKSLAKGEILECSHCNDRGFTCRIHEECWEKHKAQQKENEQDKIRCYKHLAVYISERQSMKHIPKDVSS